MLTNRNRLIISCIVLVMAVFLFALLGFIYVSKNNNVTNSNTITPQQALDIALNEAGFHRDDILYYESEFDKFGTAGKYEIEFIADGSKYEFDISANSGKLLSKNKKPYHTNIKQPKDYDMLPKS